MAFGTVFLPEASPTEHLHALEEVQDFATTDMGIPGQGPWTYRIVPAPSIDVELGRMSNAQSIGPVDSLSFQPCPPGVFQNEDRLIIQQWNLPGGQWSFTCILDGHLNHHTVDYVAASLPPHIQASLQAAFAQNPNIGPSDICRILQDCIARMDQRIRDQFLSIFPAQLNHLSPADVQCIFQNPSTGPRNRQSAYRCMGGSTLILSLTDPARRNLFVACLGDCYAVLGIRNLARWSAIHVNRIHAGNIPSEAQRIRSEHPGEHDVIQDDRILGFLEPTRAIGDSWLNLPSVYTSRILSQLDQEWVSASKLHHLAMRIKTPPYVSNIADVFHRTLPDSPCFLILSSDGLCSADTYEALQKSLIPDRWVNVVSRSLGQGNTALSLLRDALGGLDIRRVSRNMTVEMEERWMDDVTIAVQRFR